ncbi:Fungalysin metallopeptidase-domain-containing protein [Coemansia spiralis]|nr:Fungalysin metallopeptidase-domain-containing protein [Coemansia spiralis]
MKLKSAYRSDHNGVTHVHFKQVVNGLEVVNGNANVNIDKKGRVISSGNSFSSAYSPTKHTDTPLSTGDFGDKTTYISVKDALQRLAHHVKSDLLPHQLSGVEIEAATNLDGEPEIVLSGLPSSFAVGGKASAQAALLRNNDGSLVETWDLTVEQDDHWWNAQINAQTGKVDALIDWTNHYAPEPEAYRVYPWQVPDPRAGERVLVENPADKTASPAGWSRGNQTAGNNVYAQSNPDGGYGWENNFRPTSADRVFDYTLDLKKEPTSYIEAAVTQLFYTNNFMHDLFFHYGFDEASGNFQDENFSGKGRGKDAVIANAQDGSGYNNANFATPPDGRHPKMRMYVWDITSPYRDGDLEQGIVVHEYTHGISIRLTGGPANSNCLSYGEAGGMGEGWGDIFATIIRLTANNTRSDDIPMGDYSAARGIRKYPYSTSIATNPSTYGVMDKPAYWEVHAKGEVWAEIYYEVLWNLIDEHGFTPDLFSRDLTKGNTLALQLLVDGMKLQPCMPNFIDARDAILLADKQLTGGKNQCLLWKGFAKRGLGVNAELIFDSPWGGGSRTEDFDLPSECK